MLEMMYPEDELQKLWRKQRTCGALQNVLVPACEYILSYVLTENHNRYSFDQFERPVHYLQQEHDVEQRL